MEYELIIKKLKSQSNPENVKGMAKFGINTKHALGIKVPELRNLAKEIGKDHLLAKNCGIGFVRTTEKQLYIEALELYEK